MDYYSRLQKSIDFIEGNLSTPISLEEVSQKSYSSLSHFHRIFAFITGFTLKEYIRKRRLSVAAHELICSRQNVLDIALKYQYQTHETFTRAFKKAYGLNPHKFRKIKREHVLFEKIDIHSPQYKNLYSKDPVNIRFVTYNEFIVTGFSIDTSLEDDKVATDIPNFMRYFFANQLFQKIPDIIHPEKFYGIYSNLDVYNNFKFTIAYETQHLEKTPDGLDMHIIPPRNYAVFEAHGPMPEKLVNTWHYIYGNWLPNSIYERE
ncbi:MAG: AraC family transcriptional regulator, partial [Desulfobacteraceae bacterium]|nr:AraC family transcriptional regulator [Desulfobacteraceae bacterium]